MELELILCILAAVLLCKVMVDYSELPIDLFDEDGISEEIEDEEKFWDEKKFWH